eukprot:6203211-Pleurochrysis_carterae.AAC.1
MSSTRCDRTYTVIDAAYVLDAQHSCVCSRLSERSTPWCLGPIWLLKSPTLRICRALFKQG